MKNAWEIRRLPEIAEYSIGLTYSPKDVSDNGTVVLRSSNIQNNELDLSDLVRVACPVKDTLKVREGDILMCSRNGSKRLVGKTALISQLPEEMTFGTFMTIIRSESNPFLAWFFRTDAFREQIGVGENTMINQVTKYMLDAIRVPLPPLPEQQRIVGILDNAFEDIATAKANAEKNLQNARALFENHLQALFTESGPEWVGKPLGSLATLRNGINYTKGSKGDRIKIVGVRNFQNNFFAPLDDLDTVTIDGNLSEIDSLKQDDILAVRSNGNIELIGRCLLVGEVTEKISHSGFTIRVRLASGDVLPSYLCHFLKSSSSRKRLTEGGIGTNIKSLNQGTLSALIIPFPPLTTQKLIVEKLERLSEESQYLYSIYKRKIDALEALKKSLLHQAFTGKL